MISKFDEAHKRRMIRRQIRNSTGLSNEAIKNLDLETLKDLAESLDLVPYNACIIRSKDAKLGNLFSPCMLEEGHEGDCQFQNSQLNNDNEETSIAAADLGRKGGQSTSPKKIEAAKENGRKGGRKRVDVLED
jgi:hypothetical protein